MSGDNELRCGRAGCGRIAVQKCRGVRFDAYGNVGLWHGGPVYMCLEHQDACAVCEAHKAASIQKFNADHPFLARMDEYPFLVWPAIVVGVFALVHAYPV